MNEGPMTFTVEACDLDGATQRDCQRCLVANAINRRLTEEDITEGVHVYLGDAVAHAHTGIFGFLVGQELQGLIRAFDNGVQLRAHLPQTFTIEWERQA